MLLSDDIVALVDQVVVVDALGRAHRMEAAQSSIGFERGEQMPRASRYFDEGRRAKLAEVHTVAMHAHRAALQKS